MARYKTVWSDEYEDVVLSMEYERLRSVVDVVRERRGGEGEGCLADTI